MSAVYVVRTTVQPAGRADFEAWQDDEHLAALLGLPGYLGAQRFGQAGEPGRYLNVWRLSDPAVFGGPLHEAASHTPWFWRLREHCTVHVDFGLEASGGDLGAAPWRRAVTGLVVDREQPGSDPLEELHHRHLVQAPGVLQVVRVEPLDADPAARRRSLPPGTVLLTYLGDADPAALPPPPLGVERVTCRALCGYVAAGTCGRASPRVGRAAGAPPGRRPTHVGAERWPQRPVRRRG